MRRIVSMLLVFVATLEVGAGGLLKPCDCSPPGRDALRYPGGDAACGCCRHQTGGGPAGTPESGSPETGWKVCKRGGPPASTPGDDVRIEPPAGRLGIVVLLAPGAPNEAPVREVRIEAAALPTPPPWQHARQGVTVLQV